MRRLALLLVAGCSGSPAVTNIQPCGMGQCAAANAFLAAEVTPVTPASTANALQPSQEISQVFVDNDNHFSITLERAVTLDGTITDKTLGTPVPGGVVLSRPSHIAGRTDVVYTTRAGEK